MQLIAIAVLLLIGTSYGQSTCSEWIGNIKLRLDMKIIACSRFLSCFIEHICNSSLQIMKRDTSQMLNRLVPEDLQDRINKRRLVKDFNHRPRRQIVDECCLQPCPIEDLMMYCPKKAKIFDELPLDGK